MGRHSTGIMTTDACKRIELSFLLKNGYLQKGEKKYFSLTWRNRHGEETGNIKVLTDWNDKQIYIRLMYTIKDHSEGTVEDYDYKIYLTKVKSNLSIGEVLYFICPVSEQRCRILYMAYGYPKWKSRNAYQNRIYYDCQRVSKYEYASNRYWAIEEQLRVLKADKRYRKRYAGKPTQKELYIQKLEAQLEYWDRLRWSESSMTLNMRKAFDTGLYDDFLIKE